MEDRHLCWPPYFFLGPVMPLHFLILESPLFKIKLHQYENVSVNHLKFK